jgi:hypothetical protein
MFIGRWEPLSPSVRRGMLTPVAKRSQLVKETILTFQVHTSTAEHCPPDGGRERLATGL